MWIAFKYLEEILEENEKSTENPPLKKTLLINFCVRAYKRGYTKPYACF